MLSGVTIVVRTPPHGRRPTAIVGGGIVAGRVLAGARTRARPRTWFNTAEPLTLAGLRGRFVLLDFWTFCCANCLHVIDELRPLEQKYRDVLTVIGVHSPKFAHERDGRRGRARRSSGTRSTTRCSTTRRCTVAASTRCGPGRPSCSIDPEGYVVAQAAGEGQVSALDAMIASCSSSTSDAARCAAATAPTCRRRPSRRRCGSRPRRSRSATDNLLVADAGHHQLVELAGDGRRRAPHRHRPARARATTRPSSPSRTASRCCPPASRRLRRRRRRHRQPRAARRAAAPTARSSRRSTCRRRCAGQRTVTGAVPAVLSPWDVAWWPALGRLVVAAAGVHLLLAVDPGTGETSVLAGTTVEGLRDGPALRRLARAAVRPRGRRRPAVVRRLRDLGAALPHRRRRRCTPSSARGCSTSATSTGRRRRPACSTRSASRCCPTARSRCSTPTTARCAATTRPPARSSRSPRESARAVRRRGRRTVSWSSSSRPRTGWCGRCRARSCVRRRHRSAPPGP